MLTPRIFLARSVKARAAAVVAATTLLLGGVLAPSASADGTILYAAASAVGAGDCSDATDACSLTDALASVPSGGTIDLITGGDMARYVGNWTAPTTGSDDSSRVTIEGDPSLSTPPILDGNGDASDLGTSCSTSSCTGPIMTVPDGAFVAFDDVTFADAQNSTSAGGGLSIQGSADVTVAQATFTNDVDTFGTGRGGYDPGNGGGIYLDGGNLTVDGSTFTGNHAGPSGSGFGGAVMVDSGTADIDDSTFDSNGALGGGAIENGYAVSGGTVSVTDSTFEQNTARNGGGAIDNGDLGGGTLDVTSSTFANNSSQADGGAIDTGDGGTGSATVTTSTFSGNSAAFDGGAVDNADDHGSSSLLVVSSTFAGDTGNTYKQGG